MVICQKCRYKNPDGENYCGKCGERLSETSPSNPPKPKTISQKIIAADRDISNRAKLIKKNIEDNYG